MLPCSGLCRGRLERLRRSGGDRQRGRHHPQPGRERPRPRLLLRTTAAACHSFCPSSRPFLPPFLLALFLLPLCPSVDCPAGLSNLRVKNVSRHRRQHDELKVKLSYFYFCESHVLYLHKATGAVWCIWIFLSLIYGGCFFKPITIYR